MQSTTELTPKAPSEPEPEKKKRTRKKKDAIPVEAKPVEPEVIQPTQEQTIALTLPNASKTMTTAIASTGLQPALTLKESVDRYNRIVKFVSTILKPEKDYGIIPGTKKPTLYKPGAEKLATLFAFTPRFTIVEQKMDWENGLFYKSYRCSLYSRDGVLIAESDGSANSWESRYRYRWVEEKEARRYIRLRQLCATFEEETEALEELMQKASSICEFKFAIDRAETTGQYGKPQEYWETFRVAIENGTAKAVFRKSKDKEWPAYVIPSVLYRIENETIFDAVNTIEKIAQKRAFVGTILIAVNASEFFTQDWDDVIDLPTDNDERLPRLEATPLESEPESKQQEKPKTKTEMMLAAIREQLATCIRSGYLTKEKIIPFVREHLKNKAIACETEDDAAAYNYTVNTIVDVKPEHLQGLLEELAGENAAYVKIQSLREKEQHG